MDIIWLDEAQNDLINYRQHSSIITTGKVEKYISNLLKYVDFLNTLPYLGKIFFHYKNFQIRQLLYKKHRIIYYIHNNKIIIVKVIHTSRNIDSIIKYLIHFFE